jgi:hypothetical protein
LRRPFSGGRLEETFVSHNPSTVCDGIFSFSDNHHQPSGVLVMIAVAEQKIDLLLPWNRSYLNRHNCAGLFPGGV